MIFPVSSPLSLRVRQYRRLPSGQWMRQDVWHTWKLVRDTDWPVPVRLPAVRP